MITCTFGHEERAIFLENMRFPHISWIRFVVEKRNPLKDVEEEVSNKNMREKQGIATETN